MTYRETIPVPPQVAEKNIRALMARFTGYRSVFVCWVAAVVGDK